MCIAAVYLLMGCAGPSSNTRRDLDVTGQLPDAISLGAFAPTCLFFCFITNHATQGDNSKAQPQNIEPIQLHQRNTNEFKGNRPITPKGKP